MTKPCLCVYKCTCTRIWQLIHTFRLSGWNCLLWEGALELFPVIQCCVVATLIEKKNTAILFLIIHCSSLHHTARTRKNFKLWTQDSAPTQHVTRSPLTAGTMSPQGFSSVMLPAWVVFQLLCIPLEIVMGSVRTVGLIVEVVAVTVWPLDWACLWRSASVSLWTSLSSCQTGRGGPLGRSKSDMQVSFIVQLMVPN